MKSAVMEVKFNGELAAILKERIPTSALAAMNIATAVDPENPLFTIFRFEYEAADIDDERNISNAIHQELARLMDPDGLRFRPRAEWEPKTIEKAEPVFELLTVGRPFLSETAEIA